VRGRQADLFDHGAGRPGGLRRCPRQPQTHEQRLARLRATGVDEALLARIDAPIGLPLGGRSPGEIAISILAAVVQARASHGAGSRLQSAPRAQPGPPVAAPPSPGTHSQG
jgi:hypothetical protein